MNDGGHVGDFDDPVLLSVLEAACDATGATKALLLRSGEDDLTVVAAFGPNTADAYGVTVPLGQGVAGFVAASGQPVALAPHSTDTRIGEDVTSSLGWEPRAILTVPCMGNNVIAGVLELIDPLGNANFSFDDVESATLLAGIAGVALENSQQRGDTPSPDTLAHDIVNLSRVDPGRYAQVASMIEILITSV